MPQRVPSRRSRAANDAIERRSEELMGQGFAPKQAIAIALRQWNDGELLIVEPTNVSTSLREAKQQLDFAKTIGALATFYKQRKKQIDQERSRTKSRADRLRQYEDGEE